jgi:hypothetical protein
MEIRRLAQMGFARDVCEETLRIANFHAAVASQLLASQQRRVATERVFISGRPIETGTLPDRQQLAHARQPAEAR